MLHTRALSVCIVTPALADANNGNWQTARRWATLLSDQHAVRLCRQWPDDGPDADVLIALHARRSAASVAAWAQAHPTRPLLLALTGTDLYRDIEHDADAQRSLSLAKRLLVLQDQGLIKLKPEAGLKATPLDVVSNPKKLKFVELDAAQLPRSLDDLDASAINTNYALSAGLSPAKDAIAQESAKSPYVNLLAVREQDKNQPWVAKLVKAYQSEPVRQFIQSEFKGAVLAGF